MSINKIKCYGFYINPRKLDYEYAQILRKLQQYGMTATGDKQVDKMRLKNKELEMIRELGTVDSGALLVSIEEQEKIINENKGFRVADEESRTLFESMSGQKILGEQIFIAHKLKNV